MKNYTHVIWDWNGTLLNDIGASLASVNDMLARRGMEEIDIHRYRECIGIPIKVFYEQVFELEKEDYPALLTEYNEGYMHHLKKCGLTKGAQAALEYFRINGIKQIIVSSSNNEQLQSNIISFGISEYFEEILGSSDYLAGSKIDRARAYLNATSGEKRSLLVVGDLEHDAELAAEIGADCVLLSSGHEKPDRLKKAKVPIIGNLKELILFVENEQNECSNVV